MATPEGKNYAIQARIFHSARLGSAAEYPIWFLAAVSDQLSAFSKPRGCPDGWQLTTDSYVSAVPKRILVESSNQLNWHVWCSSSPGIAPL